MNYLNFNNKFFKNKNLYNQIFDILEKVYKPSRYTGIEFNSVHKLPDKIKYKVVLCYPDLYEIGMSNLSLKLFYFNINKRDYLQAERLFLPDKDIIDILEKKRIPLFSLETWTPIKDFNMVGFTIQTELIYTNILKILKLSNIPLYSRDRKESSPIIIGGGANILNPLPISPFFDLIFIGEADESFLNILEKDLYLLNKGVSRSERLIELSKIEGIWYPQIDKYKKKVKRVVVKDLDQSFHPEKEIIPFVKTIQDRPVVEIARGCNNGCRFCQAGYYYRPYRERNPINIIKLMTKLLNSSGYDQINFTSLSVADYSAIDFIIQYLSPELAKYNISLSLPSLRVYSFSVDYLKKLSLVRKMGLTFAIEAGSKDLRARINKYFDENKFFQIISEAINSGWKHIKLYFIIGFPEVENEEEYIINFIKNLSNKFKQLKLNISIALLIPKVYTAFENSEQLDYETFLEKIKKIKSKFSKKQVKISYPIPERSFFEYVLSIADDTISDFLIEAIDNNIYREGWDEFFNKDFWINKLKKFDLKKHKASLNFIDTGYNKDFFNNEYINYLKGNLIPNCAFEKCYFCGICNKKIKNIIQKNFDKNELLNEIKNITLFKNFNFFSYSNNEKVSYCIIFNKHSLLKFVGHLDFFSFLQKFLRIAGFDPVYTKGYNPKPKIFLPFAIPIFTESYSDLLFIESKSIIKNKDELLKYMNKISPEGLDFIDIIKIDSINNFFSNSKFEIQFNLKSIENNITINFDEIIKNLKLVYKDNNFKLLTYDSSSIKFSIITSKEFKNPLKITGNFFKVKRNIKILSE